MQSDLPIQPTRRSDGGHAPQRGGPTDPSHDAQLRRGILQTYVSRSNALSATLFFLIFIYAVPLSQAILEKIRGDDLVLLDLFRHVPTKASLRQFEDDLDQASYAKEATQPRVQALLTQFGRVGNKRAVVGLKHWLYYKPGITHLGGPGFLERDAIEVRQRAAVEAGEPPIHGDPRPAIVAFQEALSKRGIKLILFPVPDKAMLQPLELHGRGGPAGHLLPVAHNLDWDRFVGEMRTRGVTVFDPAPPALHSGEAPRFLVQDTHWTPEWMESVARDLAALVGKTVDLPRPASPLKFKRVAQSVESLGDVAVMLKLPQDQRIFVPQRVTIQQVQDDADNPWEPDPKGDVLLLGDSFTNVFSMEPMGWGTSAGLGAQLAFSLGRGVDVIAQNDSGAFATRAALWDALHAGEDRLAGKKTVIWEFASRELSVGDWKPIDWSAAQAEAAR
jgi:alginate O-acetyltransferase complex protein AlgJ